MLSFIFSMMVIFYMKIENFSQMNLIRLMKFQRSCNFATKENVLGDFLSFVLNRNPFPEISHE